MKFKHFHFASSRAKNQKKQRSCSYASTQSSCRSLGLSRAAAAALGTSAPLTRAEVMAVIRAYIDHSSENLAPGRSKAQ